MGESNYGQGQLSFVRLYVPEELESNIDIGGNGDSEQKNRKVKQIIN